MCKDKDIMEKSKIYEEKSEEIGTKNNGLEWYVAIPSHRYEKIMRFRIQK